MLWFPLSEASAQLGRAKQPTLWRPGSREQMPGLAALAFLSFFFFFKIYFLFYVCEYTVAVQIVVNLHVVVGN